MDFKFKLAFFFHIQSRIYVRLIYEKVSITSWFKIRFYYLAYIASIHFELLFDFLFPNCELPAFEIHIFFKKSFYMNFNAVSVFFDFEVFNIFLHFIFSSLEIIQKKANRKE